MRRLGRKIMALSLTLTMLLGMVPAMAAENDVSGGLELHKSALEARERINLSENWKFCLTTSADPSAEQFNDSAWDTVTIPHTWNALDGQSGSYVRSVGWYRKTLPWDDSYEGKQIYLEFLGASMQADIYVNGTLIGSHKGGYTAFRCDLTDVLREGDNVVAVRVDNRKSEEIAPLSGDWTHFGGIYREVSLIITDPVHVDTMDMGSSGLYLTTTEVSRESAKLGVRAKIVNDSNTAQEISVTALLRYPDHFEADEFITTTLFDPEDMAPGGEPLRELTETFTLAAGESYTFEQTTVITNPHLWNGREDPFRYLVDLKVEAGGRVADQVSEYVGFRYFSADEENGFFLNGYSYPLRGVSRHQDRRDMGWAITKREHDEDMALIYEIGANAVRLAHYPQAPYFYELCDKYGIVVWAEIPFVNAVGTADTFQEVTENQLKEMIRQQYNRPSICFWGLENEVGSVYDAQMRVLMASLNEIAHTEDPTGRLTTQAANHDKAQDYWPSDVLAFNCYPMWYSRAWYSSGSLKTSMDKRRGHGRALAVSEYGAGGNPQQHEEDPEQPATAGPWHPEEYQNKVHEMIIRDIDQCDYLWGTFCWNMFDFASAGRNEGGQRGINDKGLVTHDRKTKKDSFYLYKANWNEWDRFSYITSRRWDPREENPTTVKIYSNCDEVTLLLNDEPMGTKSNEDHGIFTWPDITLPEGENTLTAVGKMRGSDKEYRDTVIWNKIKGTAAEVTSEVLSVDNAEKKIGLTKPITVEKLSEILFGVRGATYTVCQEDEITPVTSGSILPGMKLICVSEDENARAVYVFMEAHLAANKTVTASSSQNAQNAPELATDFDRETRWTAGSTGCPEWIQVDLGDIYCLNSITIDWYGDTSRTYQYTVEVGNDGEKGISYVAAVDRSNNQIAQTVTDGIGGIWGRYVRIYVTGKSGGRVSLYEIAVNGWKMAGNTYAVDHERRTIRVPLSNEVIPDEEFFANLDIKGNCTYEILGDDRAYYITNGEVLAISDESGYKTEYTILIGDGSQTLEEVKADALAALNKMELSNSVTPQQVLETVRKVITDNAIIAGWRGGEDQGFRFTPATPFNGKLQLSIELERGDDSLLLELERSFDQQYRVISTGKQTYSSGEKVSESGFSSCVNDGDTSTRWTAPLRHNNDKGKPYYYDFPEWVAIDLGEIYDLTELTINFFAKRYYKYEILTATEGVTLENDLPLNTVREGFTQVVDMTGNTQKGILTHTLDGQARYVLINVVSCEEYDKNPDACRGAASIYEIEITGREAPSQPGHTHSWGKWTLQGNNLVRVCEEDATHVQSKLFAVTVAGEEQIYDGKPHTPAVTLTAGADTLQPGVDYTVTYADNVDAGEASFTVTGQNRYDFQLEQSFSIARAEVPTPTPGKFNIANRRENEYSYLLALLCPQINEDSVKEDRKEWGKRKYTIKSVEFTETGYYDESRPARIDTAEGGELLNRLYLPVAANDTTATGKVATVTVIIDSDNFQRFENTVEVYATNKALVGFEGFIVPDKTYDGAPYTYEGELRVMTRTGDVYRVDADVEITYVGRNLTGYSERPQAPTNAGEFAMIVRVSDNDDSYIGRQSYNFTIHKASGQGSVTMADYVVGQPAPEPEAASETNDAGHVSYEYKAKGAPDSSYTAVKPTEPGEYTVRARFPAALNYTEVEATADFTVTSGLPPVPDDKDDDDNNDEGDDDRDHVPDRPSVTVSNGPSITVSGGGSAVADAKGNVVIAPAKGNRITGVIVNGKRVSIPKLGRLTGLKSPDRVEVIFEPIGSVKLTAYTDLTAGAWYTEAVRYVMSYGLFNGTSEATFSPYTPMTRGMLATVLHRVDGTPDSGRSSFADVINGTWYTDAVSWAAEKGIVTGYDTGNFGPDDLVTREQIAVMLWRYAGRPTGNGVLNSFVDGDRASDYALNALRWAVEQEILTGKDGGVLDPTGFATRVEVSAMIARFCEKFQYIG